MVDTMLLLVFALLILFDGLLMLHARGAYPERVRRSILLDMPSISFATMAYLGKSLYQQGAVDPTAGVIVLALAMVAMILWEIIDGFPVHPLIAAIAGALSGMIFWPPS